MQTSSQLPTFSCSDCTSDFICHLDPVDVVSQPTITKKVLTLSKKGSFESERYWFDASGNATHNCMFLVLSSLYSVTKPVIMLNTFTVFYCFYPLLALTRFTRFAPPFTCKELLQQQVDLDFHASELATELFDEVHCRVQDVRFAIRRDKATSVVASRLVTCSGILHQSAMVSNMLTKGLDREVAGNDISAVSLKT